MSLSTREMRFLGMKDTEKAFALLMEALEKMRDDLPPASKEIYTLLLGNVVVCSRVQSLRCGQFLCSREAIGYLGSLCMNIPSHARCF